MISFKTQGQAYFSDSNSSRVYILEILFFLTKSIFMYQAQSDLFWFAQIRISKI